jgi:hypothetical protein
MTGKLWKSTGNKDAGGATVSACDAFIVKESFGEGAPPRWVVLDAEEAQALCARRIAAASAECRQYKTLDTEVNSFAYGTYEDLQHPVDNTVDTAVSSHTAARGSGLFTASAGSRGALLCSY